MSENRCSSSYENYFRRKIIIFTVIHRKVLKKKYGFGIDSKTQVIYHH